MSFNKFYRGGANLTYYLFVIFALLATKVTNMRMKNNNGNPSYFSPAELRVVELLTRGYSIKEIADKLCLSEHTVDNHI